MKHDCLLINGDSYSAEVKEHSVYGDFLSESLDIPVKNFAKPGSNNDRIVRSSIEYLIELKKEYKNPLVIIGWSFVRRQEIWYYGRNSKIISNVFDNPFSRLTTLDWLLNENEATPEQKAMILPDKQIHKALTDFYTDLFLLSNFLRYNHVNFFWFSAARNTDCAPSCFPYLESLALVKEIEKDPCVFQLHDFCVMNWAKDNDPDSHPVTGHLSEQGHKKFAEFLLGKLPIDR